MACSFIPICLDPGGLGFITDLYTSWEGRLDLSTMRVPGSDTEWKIEAT